MSASAVDQHNGTSALTPERQVVSPGSRFTAVNSVNGRDSSAATQKPSHANGIPRRESFDQQQAAMPRMTASAPDQSTSVAQSPVKDEGASPQNGQAPTRHSPQSSYQGDSEASHKRKRSGSQGVTDSSAPTTASAVRDLLSPSDIHRTPSGPPHGHDRDMNAGPQQQHPVNIHRAAYMEQPYPPPIEQQSAQWYARQSQEHAANMPPSNPEDRLREAFSREAQVQAQREMHAGYGPPSNESQYDDSIGDRSMSSAPGTDGKKRKRNFSNRTKTGCMTCRKRKKKCDEARPECSNCLRGGFTCAGYPSRAGWNKGSGIEGAKPSPLAISPGYEMGAMAGGSAPPQQQYTLPLPTKREPLPFSRQPPRVDTQQPPSHLGIEDRLNGPNTSSPDTRHASAYAQTSPFPTPVSAQPNAYGTPAQYDYSQGQKPPPYMDTPRRHEMDLHTPQSAHSQSLPPIQMIGAPQGSQGTSPHPLTQSTTNDAAQAAAERARLALSHPASQSTRPSAKEAMLAGNGTDFYPFDRELVAERERCSAACWRFNSSTNPNTGVSPEERARFFANILMPPQTALVSPSESSGIHVSGRVGRDVVVEAPFTCDYGYNIKIGNEVAIGKNCTILDSCEVIIGDKVVIGPNVNIYTEYLDTDPRRRGGSKGPRKCKRVIIQDNVWIGGNVTILPGITIENGATVGAGCVVTRNVKRWTVCRGDGAKATVLRGVYGSN